MLKDQIAILTRAAMNNGSVTVPAQEATGPAFLRLVETAFIKLMVDRRGPKPMVTYSLTERVSARTILALPKVFK